VVIVFVIPTLVTGQPIDRIQRMILIGVWVPVLHLIIAQ
jgi:hypothetical protein